MNRIRMKIEDVKIRKSMFIYVFFSMVMVLTIINKRNFHIDEMCSYILSNSTDNIVMEFEEGYTYSPEMIYLENIAVMNVEEQFNFANVWANQTKDVHPPLYYLILHIICSFYVGKFSIWYAAVINLCFALLTLYILRKMMNVFIKDTVVIDLGSILFALSVGVLQNVSFLRMYVMAMFWVILMTFFCIKVYESKFTWKLWIEMGAIAIASALTHYYCIIFLCASCLVLGVYLLNEKRWVDIVALCISMTIAALVSITIFPAMLTHMFSGYRGAESMDNLMQGTWREWGERIKSFYEYINIEMLGKIGGVAAITFLLFGSCILLQKQQNWRRFFNKNKKYFIVGFPIVIYFIFVSKSAVYVTDRYLFPIYASAFGLLWCAIYNGLEKLTEKNRYIVICLIGAILIVNEYTNTEWNYLYKESEELLNRAKEYSDENCICVYDVKSKTQPAFLEMKNYKSVTFISQENSNSILQRVDLMNDGFILEIMGGNDDEIINMVLESIPYLDRYEKIGEYMYGKTYRIFSSTYIAEIYNYDKSGVIGADDKEYGSNVLLSTDEQPITLLRKDEDYIMLELYGLALDVTEAKYEEGTNIQLYFANGTDAQMWKLIENMDGSYTLFAKDDRFVLSCGDDGNIYLSEYHKGEKSQKWWIRESGKYN